MNIIKKVKDFSLIYLESYVNDNMLVNIFKFNIWVLGPNL